MSLVIAAGEALILFQFHLDQVELLLADDCWDLGGDDPFLGWQRSRLPLPPPTGLSGEIRCVAGR
jgi:hypothetical protein